MENKTLDLLSKLLASENITILRDRVPTASFDIINRVLRLPMLMNMSDEEETMLAFHEVSHALFTPEDYVNYIKKEQKQRPQFHHYLNVVEDVRVERLFKEKFPGARKDFFKGYSSFNNRDFFKLSSKDVNALTIIDRINVFYKVGFSAGVKFTAEERAFITKIDKCETIEDVYNVSIELYLFAATQQKNNMDSRPEIVMEDEFDFEESEESDDEDNDDFGDYESDEESDETENGDSDKDSEETDEESDEESETKSGKSKVTDEESQETEESDSEETAPGTGVADVKNQAPSEDHTSKETIQDSRVIGDPITAPESQTQESFDNNVKRNTSISGSQVLTVMMEGTIEPIVVTHNKIAADARVMIKHYKHMTGAYSKFRAESNKMVSHLVKEFEMRKAAKRYARTQTAPTGELSMNKIAKFKVSDDIFKKLDIVADDSNHGFMMLVDWSGSMQTHMRDTIGQVITLSSFCRRCNIPFTVYAFSDNISNYFNVNGKSSYERDNTVTPGYGMIHNELAVMFNFFNNKMSNSDFETIAQFLYDKVYCRRVDPMIDSSEAPYQLNGTPLVSGLLFAEKNIEKFKRANNVEKMTLITLTDGDGNSGGFVNTQGRYISHGHGYMKFLKHPKSNATISVGMETKLETAIIQLIQRSNPGLKTIGFFVTDFKMSAIREYVYKNQLASTERDIKSIAETIIHTGRKNGFCDLPVSGYSKMFFIKDSAETATVDLSQVDQKMTASQMSKTLTKSLSSAVKSRVVLTKFIEQVA